MSISPRKRRLFRRAAILVAVLCGCGYLLLNGAARWILLHQIRQISGMNAEIDSVRITLTSAVVRGMRISDSSSNEAPLLTVTEVHADLTLFDGFTGGKFANAVTITGSSVQLEFSEEGDLLTALPEFGSGLVKTPIPFRRLHILDAEIHVRQHGGKRVDLNGLKLAVQCDDSLVFAAVAPKLFDSKWTCHGQLHPETLAGSATLVAKSIQLGADDIRQLPLVTHIAEIPMGSQVTGDMFLTLKFPANIVSVFDCAAELRLDLLSLDVPVAGIQAAAGMMRVTQKEGQVRVNADCSILGGSVRIDGEVAILAATPGGKLNWTAQNIALNSVFQRLNLPAGGILDLSGSAAASVSTEQIQFDSSVQSNVSTIFLCGVPVDPLHSSMTVNGAVKVTDGTVEIVHGEMEFAAESQGCQLEQAIPQLARFVSRERTTETGSEINQLLQRLQPSGRASFVACAKAPLTAFHNPEQITGTVRVNCDGVSTSEFRIEDSIAAFDVAAGHASLSLSETRITHVASGRTSTINFKADAPLHPEAAAIAEFRMAEFPLAFPASLLGLREDEFGGDVSVAAVVNVPMNRLLDVMAYSGHGTLSAPHLVAKGEVISNAQLEWSLGSGRFSVHRFGGQVAAVAMQGNAHLSLVSPYRFAGTCTVSATELESLSRVACRLSNADLGMRGALEMKCLAEGEMASKRFSLNGSLLLQDFAIRNGQPTTLNLNLRAIPESLSVESAHGQFFGGDMTMTASLNGNGQISAIVGDVRRVQMPLLYKLLGTRMHSDGAVAASFAFSEPLLPDRISGSATLASQLVNISGIAVEGLETKVLVDTGAIQASVNATIAGALCDATLRTDVSSLLSLTAESFNKPDQLPVEMEARMTQLSVARIRGPLQQLTGIKLPTEFTGIVSGSAIRTSETARAGHVATADVSLKAIGWNRKILSNQLIARLRIRPRLLEVHDISGTVAEGSVEGYAMLNLNDQPDGMFRMAVSGINLTKAALPIVNDTRSIQGRASLRVDGRIGRRMTGQANLMIDSILAYGVSASHVRVPLKWTIVPAQRLVHVHTNNASLDLGGGRVNGKADVRWDGRLNLNMTAQAQQIDTRRLLASRGSLPGGGVVSGTLRLRGESVSSIDDLSGQFDAQIKDVQALQMPVLQNASQFLGSVGRTTSFEDGILSGRLANGMITIDRMALMAASVRIIIEGTSTLTGQLNLYVSAYTGETGPADKILKLTDSPLMLAAPVPIAMIAQANDMIKDRTVHLHVTGSAQRPLIRVQPGRQLQQEVIQLLVKSALSSVPGGRQVQSAMHENSVR